MGKVAMKLKILTEGPHVDTEKMKKEIEELVHPDSVEEQEIGFGLKSLVVLVTVEDKEGVADALDKKLRSINGVSNVETLDITLI